MATGQSGSPLPWSWSWRYAKYPRTRLKHPNTPHRTTVLVTPYTRVSPAPWQGLCKSGAGHRAEDSTAEHLAQVNTALVLVYEDSEDVEDHHDAEDHDKYDRHAQDGRDDHHVLNNNNLCQGSGEQQGCAGLVEGEAKS